MLNMIIKISTLQIAKMAKIQRNKIKFRKFDLNIPRDCE